MWGIKSLFIFPIHLLLQLSNMSFWGILVIILGFFKLLLPIKSLQPTILSVMHYFYMSFSVISVALIKIFNKPELNITIDRALSENKWYLIIANHISYLDIILLINFCNKRIPPPKFFLKKELIWLPIVGLAAWAMDMPFMQRYSKKFLAQHPHLKGKDIETTRRSCQKYINQPTTVINFVEGTRFTSKKQISSGSSYTHLLRPKAGGIAFTLASMGELFSEVLDITLAYPNTKHPMMDMLGGRMNKIVIDVKTIPVHNKIIGDYFENETFKKNFQLWLNERWQEKDQRIRQWLN
ncbi:acyltransferase [Agaribacter flavus]|uniref:Acyltransferase n=1 Tax=Agaribacter flavus TaxID=1902781 RepID=A0ABV7FPP0_9ALTE